MNDFTASNGIGVEINDEEQIVFAVPNRPTSPLWMKPDELGALREFFRAEEDERLGRWRDARYPDFAVYPQPVDPSRGAVRGVTILSERIPRIYTAWEDNLRTFYGDSEDEETRRTARDVAAAYFDAHPEPKPWHDAEPEEVWVLTIDGEEVLALIDGDREFYHRSQRRFRSVLDESITAGRRIWPEVTS